MGKYLDILMASFNTRIAAALQVMLSKGELQDLPWSWIAKTSYRKLG